MLREDGGSGLVEDISPAGEVGVAVLGLAPAPISAGANEAPDVALDALDEDGGTGDETGVPRIAVALSSFRGDGEEGGDAWRRPGAGLVGSAGRVDVGRGWMEDGSRLMGAETVGSRLPIVCSTLWLRAAISADAARAEANWVTDAIRGAGASCPGDAAPSASGFAVGASWCRGAVSLLLLTAAGFSVPV
ncbi:hypothetical protein [Allopusillimonas soli]|uniref:Uncharacterized protein n=1 Tax=Allopusillimonas soli TaxID=659016 RepID=A0A853F8A7_9BURK|nr:hypothetical protein [Allopusillimonas soli]NYT36864.1 hypothetical protein [Allopusillimonas soli]